MRGQTSSVIGGVTGNPYFSTDTAAALLAMDFFFQSEHGIRDRTVTGVQTCALPIYLEQSIAQDPGLLLVATSDSLESLDDEIGERRPDVIVLRSEERRVGKEWRSRMASSRLKKHKSHARSAKARQ